MSNSIFYLQPSYCIVNKHSGTMATATSHAFHSHPNLVKPVDRAFVSIVIPTLNEIHNLRKQINSLKRLPEVEIIFADGGSTDGTVDEIQRHAVQNCNVHLIRSPRCRSRQMNAGARHAIGEWIIFLHADTELPPESFKSFLQAARQNSHLKAGAFTFKVSNPKWVYRYLEHYVGLRCKLLKLPYGDQAIFARRCFFEEMGGYRDDFPLMEDMEFVERCNKLDSFSVLRFPVYTSARRFENDGYLKRTCGNLYLQMLYKFGVHPTELAKKYWKNQ